MFRRSLIAVTAAATALVLASCSAGGNPEPTDDEAARGDRLTLISISSPTNYDLGVGAEAGTRSQFFEAVFDTLLRADSAGEISPRLATDWSYDDTLTELTLTLREDVTFSDGTALDAAAVVASLEHTRDGSSQAAGAAVGQTYEAVDDYTVKITLPAPNPSYLGSLAVTSGLIAAPSSFDNDDVDTNPVGSGPFILDTESTVIGTTYNYTANPDYWDPESIRYDHLTINTIADPTATLNAILAGETNGAVADNNALEEIEGAGWDFTESEGAWEGLMLYDRDGAMAPALADVRVRQAINMAFDRESLLEAVQGGHGTVTTQIFMPNTSTYDPELDKMYAYDPEGAKELLTEAGYPDGFTMTMPLIAAFQTSLDLLKQQLADVGITVEYVDPGQGQYIASILTPKHPAAWMNMAGIGDWDAIGYMVSPAAVFNPFRTQQDQVDDWLYEIQNATDEADASMTDLKAYLVEEAWFAPFYRVNGNYTTDAETDYDASTWVSGAYPSIFGFSPAS
ncbi:peptide/nickel transport system substrate-binding protein [Microbacterium terrae]|uniref:Glutathione-binding protein GsiB n=1 Tax=Microbacterium terrae TaxID=69369 RepID=A0A0M2GVI2_9MICO|nr:ABC transporter substrate-binding protein [Microbacterium terrae]KJL37517.1 Glutathione-binding protein GsiB precursor [Microbacterium terrae]MBP1076346.1 peptide/nickel transport system substrate-binding protein [Microbacterium terrae]GLJ97170.1 peptide ABC transporter substrate-binding protein [Microbacterium terrae]